MQSKEGNMKKRSLVGEEENINERKRMKPGDGFLVQNKYGDGVSWSRGAMIGKGSFGSVFLATLKKPNSKHSPYPSVMAVKSAEVSVSGSIQKETEVLNNICGCSNVIGCLGEEITNGDNGQMVYNLLLEYASAGSLAGLINKSGGDGLPELDVRQYTRSILRGLSHIHKCGYVHCDLKPENILMVAGCRSGGGFKAKIGDLGLAKRSKQSGRSRFDPYMRGTPMYLSPETVIAGVQEPPSDVWAVGCIVLEMLTGKTPWDSKLDSDVDAIFRQIGEENKSPCVPSTVSTEGRNFLKSCFTRNPLIRPTAERLLDLPFIKGLPDDDDKEEADEGLGEIQDINAISSSVYSETDDNDEEELMFSSYSDCSSYLSEDEFSSWSEDDADEAGLQAEEETNVELVQVQQHHTIPTAILV